MTGVKIPLEVFMYEEKDLGLNPLWDREPVEALGGG